MTTPTADLWHHYGRTRHATDRAVPDRFSWSWSWSWSQDSGPGAAVLGARTPDGEVAGMRRWVLQEQVWPNPRRGGLHPISTQTLPGGTGPRAADALLVTAFPTDRSAA